MADPSTSVVPFAPPPTASVAVPEPTQGVRRVTPEVELTDFNDKAVRQYEFEYYTPKLGFTDRIFLLRVGDIAKGRSHFHDNMKSGVLCRSVYTRSADNKSETLTETKKCCEWMGPSQVRFAALVIQYATLKDGNPASPFSLETKLWRFGVDKYKQLQAINVDYPLSRHDVAVLCTEEKYQRLQMQAKPESWFLHPNFPADERTRLQQWAASSVAKLPSQMGRVFANDQDLYKALVEAKILITGGQMPAMVQPGDAPVANFDDIITSAIPQPPSS